jgi:zinc transport system substrate-binding protein
MGIPLANPKITYIILFATLKPFVLLYVKFVAVDHFPMMRKVFLFLLACFLISCGSNKDSSDDKIITVSIAPFSYFVKKIAGDDFKVNIMVPPGADPHIYEPFPEQISRLRKSVAYISNGYLGFEMNWLERFYETNPAMKRLSLGDAIEPLSPEDHHEGGHAEGADPHYWVSPRCALLIAQSVKNLLCELNPSGKQKYEANYLLLRSTIQELDEKCNEYFLKSPAKAFMIYHPNLAYIARDYSLREIPVEFEGKEPSPSRMKELIDLARTDHLKTIFVQREYDTKNAKVIAGETGADIVIIDPLSEDWEKSTSEIIEDLHKSLMVSSKQ